MSKVILTRYLYLFDEVGLTFIMCLLKAKSIDECYFWITELYLSGCKQQSWELLWFIYYDFYHILNPQFEPFLYKKSLSGDIKSILTVVKNMFKMASSTEVFITRQYNSNIREITHIFKGKKPNWLLNIPNKYHGLFRFIDKKLYHFAVSSLPDVIEPDIYQAIQTYFKLTDEQFTIIRNLIESSLPTTKENTETVEGTEEGIEEGIEDDETKSKNQYVYKNAIHVLWSAICLLIFNPEWFQSKKKIFIGSTDDEFINVMKIHMDPIPLNKNKQPQIYNTLVYKRLYSIDATCSAFHLLRETEEDINKCYYYHWEYYAYLCPLWKKRFDKYNITIDDANNKIIFNDDDEMEMFYSQYGYQPDELPWEAENKRIICMPTNISWKDWYNSIFTEKPVYEFTDDFKFNY